MPTVPSGHGNLPPSGTAACVQKTWDAYKIEFHGLQNAPHDRARLLADSAKESGAWLNALPSSSLGLRMDDDTIRVAPPRFCRPHTCQHCDVEVDQLGLHGLSCKMSEGRHYRHSAMNDILHRAMTSAQILSRLEPSGLVRSDGKRPDGVTLVPRKDGKSLIWDATCPDTLAQSYRAAATSSTGAVAAGAETKKLSKYDSLAPSHTIVPVAIESLGNRSYLDGLFEGPQPQNKAAFWGGEGPPVPPSATFGGSAEGECHLNAELCG